MGVLPLSLSSFILSPFEFDLKLRVGFLVFMSVGVVSLTVYAVLKDNVGLCGAFCVWLTTEKREWLSGRYVSANRDADKLEKMRKEILDGNKLMFRMVVWLRSIMLDPGEGLQYSLSRVL